MNENKDILNNGPNGAEISPDEEKRIRQAFKDKDWAEIKSTDSWVIFKVMAEFVQGFEKLAKIGPCVTIFGSARSKPGSENYLIGQQIGPRYYGSRKKRSTRSRGKICGPEY